MDLCSYGCGNIGNYQLKNGKWCCKKSPNKCPALRKKNSEKTKLTNKFTINANDIKEKCKWCNEEHGVSSISKHEKSCYLNPINKKLCPVCDNPIKNFKDNKTCSCKCARKYFAKQYKKYGRKGKNLTYRTICFDNHNKVCIICGEKNIVEVHHYDKNHENNEPSNLIPLCPTHHRYIGSKFEYLISEQVEEYKNKISNIVLSGGKRKG